MEGGSERSRGRRATSAFPRAAPRRAGGSSPWNSTACSNCRRRPCFSQLAYSPGIRSSSRSFATLQSRGHASHSPAGTETSAAAAAAAADGASPSAEEEAPLPLACVVPGDSSSRRDAAARARALFLRVRRRGGVGVAGCRVSVKEGMRWQGAGW